MSAPHPARAQYCLGENSNAYFKARTTKSMMRRPRPYPQSSTSSNSDSSGIVKHQKITRPIRTSKALSIPESPAFPFFVRQRLAVSLAQNGVPIPQRLPFDDPLATFISGGKQASLVPFGKIQCGWDARCSSFLSPSDRQGMLQHLRMHFSMEPRTINSEDGGPQFVCRLSTARPQWGQFDSANHDALCRWNTRLSPGDDKWNDIVDHATSHFHSSHP